MPKRDRYKDILRSHNLRITECRLDVIEYFFRAEKTLSQSDLEHQFTDHDPVTLYRTLNSFFDSGIIHKIPNATGSATYGLCPETCSPAHHQHNHIHFKCTKCGQIECLVDKTVPSVSVPVGYQVETVNLIVDGVCAKCA